MPAHPLSSATISFRLVSVPVKLFSSAESKASISFNWLHKDDNARLKQKYVCSKDDKEVPNEDRIKGYEFAKNQYVTFTTEELKNLEEKSTGSIDIKEFVPFEKVDRIYLDK